jgi:hypothetical protein
MIDVKELRFGNIVELADNGNWVDEAVGNRYVVDFSVFQSIYYGSENYSPVKLTTDILEKCGFAWVQNMALDGCKVYSGKGMHLLYDNQYFYFRYKHIANPASDEIKNFKIAHLHALQNIYFALTNTELNIQL